MKKWIAHSEGFAKGRITVNRQAFEVLISDKAISLLPVGITAVEGEFEKDDIVQIVSPDGVAFAAGRIACSSDRARALIGAQGGRPLIHYDYLYIDRTRL